MKILMYGIICILIVIATLTVFIKTTNHFLKSVDPLAQQIAVLDNARSPEVVKIKGELMRDLIINYYRNNDTLSKKK